MKYCQLRSLYYLEVAVRALIDRQRGRSEEPMLLSTISGNCYSKHGKLEDPSRIVMEVMNRVQRR